MSVDTKPFALDVDALSPTINRRAINSALKDEEALNATFIGQERAREALTFGLGINTKGYNLYVMGEPATGRFTLVKDYIERQVSQLSAPDDWCYINNFEEEREPVALKFPPGGGKAFHKDMAALIDDVLDSLPIAFDNPGYQRRRASISREFEQKYDAAIDAVERYAQANDVALYEEGGSITFSPIINGKPISDTEFASFTDEQRKGFYILIDELENRLSESLLSLPTWKRENSERLRELDKKTAEQGIKPLIKVLEHKYASELGVMKYLKQLKNALVSAILVIHGEEQKEEKSDDFDKKVFLEEQFLPNVLVSNKLDDAAPVIYEPNPTYQNLFGKIEYTNVHGSVFTNYRMIQPGALHRANGGYLLLDVDQLIEQPFVWDTLKLAIKSQRLRMDLPQQDVGMVNNITLNPQPIDLNVKIVLLGSRDLYYTLQDYDDEFDELFRVLVDFDLEIPVTRQALFDFVGKVRAHLIHLGLKGITVNAMCRLV
ncbi:MAG TPA: ATP-dependent protease, partial [Alteromonas mediterranea]|nr:ATP-dependent protease [Alteromonas mediterranea]